MIMVPKTSKLKRFLLPIAVVLLTTSSLSIRSGFAAGPKPGDPSKPIAERLIGQGLPFNVPPVETRYLFAPHWTSQGGFKTTVYIRNVHIEQALTVKLSLVLGQGMLDLGSQSIGAQQTIAVDINQSLTNRGQNPYQDGAAVIEFEGQSVGQVNAFAHVVDTRRSLSFTFPFLEVLSSQKAAPLEGVAWYHGDDCQAFVGLQNTTDKTAVARVTAFVSGRTTVLGDTTLSSYGTAIVKIPKPAKDQFGNTPQTVGLRIESQAGPCAIVAQGWVMDDLIGFSAPFGFHQMSDCKCADGIQHQYGAGIMIGDGGMVSPGTVFSPYLAVRNNSANTVTINPTFSFDGAGGGQNVTLPAIKLSAQQSTLVNLRSYQTTGLIPPSVQMGNIDLAYRGAAGAVIAELASTDQSGSFVSPVPLTCRGNKEVHMGFWRTDDSWESVVNIQNIAPEQNDLEITIAYPGGKYILEEKIAPNASAMISVNELQQSQTPDKSGNVIPVDISTGGLDIWSTNVGDGLIVNPMLMNPLTRTCGSCGANGYILYVFPVESFANIQTTTGFQTHICGDQFGLAMVLVWSSGSRSQDLCQNVNCSDETVAGMSSSNMECYGAGTTSVSAFTTSTWPTSSDCASYDIVYGYDPLPVNPTISGTNTIWWFASYSPSGYITATTLTASPSTASSYQWVVVSGNVKFSNGSTSMTTATNQALVRSSGRSPETSRNDVVIKVTVNGSQSSGFKMTVLAPHSLVPVGVITDTASGTQGYVSLIHYSIRDQYGTQLPASVDGSEFFTSGNIADYSGENWPTSGASGGTIPDPGNFTDQVGGPSLLGLTPPAEAPNSPLSSTKVLHRTGQFQIGSTVSGQGIIVQTHTWQHWVDHGRHVNITSPVAGQ